VGIRLLCEGNELQLPNGKVDVSREVYHLRAVSRLAICDASLASGNGTSSEAGNRNRRWSGVSIKMFVSEGGEKEESLKIQAKIKPKGDEWGRGTKRVKQCVWDAHGHYRGGSLEKVPLRRGNKLKERGEEIQKPFCCLEYRP